MPPRIDRVQNPAARANFFSIVFFCWMNSIFRKGGKRDLELNDIYEVLPEENSKLLGNKLGKFWEVELKKSATSKKEHKASLLKAISNQFFKAYMLIGLFAFVEECVLLIVQPIILGLLIRYFTGNENLTVWHGWVFASSVTGLTLIAIFVHHPFFFGVFRIGSQVRIACCSLIYRKALRLSQHALSQTTIGQMVNLLSNDVNRFDQSSVFLHYLWITPIQVLLTGFVLWQYFGPYCFYGLAILIIFVPFQGLMGQYFSKLRVLTAEKSDARIRLMNEFLNGIRFIKMYAWEIPFAALVSKARKEEIKVIRRTNHLRAINMGIAFISSKIIIFVTLLTYVISEHSLTAERVFVTLTLFNNLRVTVTLFLPNAVAQLAEALVSVKRLQTFLLLEERPPTCHDNNILEIGQKTEPIDNPGTITFDHFSAKWNSTHDDNSLSDINLKVAHGDLVAIIGHVGAGKSSLLQAILKELPPTQGHVKVTGSFGYTAQEPWIFAGTVRENILFGRNFDPEWYAKVVNVCALKQDLKLWPYGDATRLGDKGASLSGGQKARVALCRAVYANADVYLLDDPLSAVDAEVGKHIFEKCIMGILKEKTRILVTHQLQFLEKVNRIIMLDHGGKVQMEASYDQFIKSGLDFAKVGQSKEADDPDVSEVKAALALARRRPTLDGSMTSILRYDASIPLGDNPQFGISAHEEICVLASEHESLQYEVTSGEVSTDPGSTDEPKSSGTVRWSLYWKYFRAGSSSCILLILVLSTLIGQFLFTTCDYWLNIWTKNEHTTGNSTTTKLVGTSFSTPAGAIDQYFVGKSRNYYVYVYSGIVGVFSIFSLIRTLLFFKVCMDSSVGIHNASFQAIVRAPMKFFEVNPLGRVVNRFSKDVGFVDDALPVCFFDAVTICLTVCGIVVLICFVNPYLMLPGIILFFIFWMLRSYYLKTARSVKRLEGTVRSPVFSHLSASLYGLTTIRAYGAEQEFIEQFDQHQDLHSATWFLFIASSRWFGIRLDLISFIFITVVTLSFMLTAETGSGPEVGLAISSVLVLSGMFQWGVRQSAEVSNQMVCVERVLDYTTLKPEAPLESSADKKPPVDWPTKGVIELRNVVVRYAQDTPPVLQISSIQIHSREKIGIVGRTGAGKSTVLTALFRLVEPTGEILIDGINILELGLHDLRSRISIMPQDPVLFTGTIRTNLDPFTNFNDDTLWSVLKKVHLSETVKEITGGLNGQITEGGANLSLGERQLMCLGRVILRKSRILVLDEATASVDPETDALIQITIREMFEDCTVITIAHRLNTVMDSDRILVLEAGKVKDFDEPYILLQNETSVLYHLVKDTGPVSMSNLFQIAKAKYEKRHKT